MLWHACMQNACIFTYAHKNTGTSVHTKTHTLSLSRAHTHTHTHKHTRAHTHTKAFYTHSRLYSYTRGLLGGLGTCKQKNLRMRFIIYFMAQTERNFLLSYQTFVNFLIKSLLNCKM